MLCTRFLPRPPLLSCLRNVSHGTLYETPDKRRVFYNKQKTQIENWRMVKELEEANYDADSEKPGRGTAERFVPRTKTIPVQKSAPNPNELPSHVPYKDGEYMRQGNLVWKKSDGCVLCNNNINVSYKNVALLYQFVSNSGMLLGPQKTGLCHMSHQVITDCIAVSREMGLMAYDYKPLEYQNAGTCFNPSVKDVGH